MDRLASPGSTEARYVRMGTPRRRQLSTTEKIAAILGPASLLPQVQPVLTSERNRAHRVFSQVGKGLQTPAPCPTPPSPLTPKESLATLGKTLSA